MAATNTDEFCLNDNLGDEELQRFAQILASVPTSVEYPKDMYGITIIVFYYLFSKFGEGEVKQKDFISDTVITRWFFKPKGVEEKYLPVGFPDEEVVFLLDITNLFMAAEIQRHNILSLQATNDEQFFEYFSMHVEKGDLVFNDTRQEKVLSIRSNMYTFYNKMIMNRLQNQIVEVTYFLLKVIRF